MNLVIAGGGTGGHLYPGIAIAEALRRRDDGSRVLFVGTARGIEATAVPKAGFELELIEVAGLKRMSRLAQLKTLVALPMAGLRSVSILRRARADAVIGVGGYASGPLVMAAWLLGVPAAICEQNSVPGVTNRILGRFVRRVFTMFPSSADHFASGKVRLVGSPVRQSFLDAVRAGSRAPEPGRVFVFGGSQGARPLNEHVPAALQALVEDGRTLHIKHQTGKADLDAVTARYRDLGVEAEVVPFIDDMVGEYRRAEIVICRAGATSCAELTALGVPSVLVPFPQAADDHQTKNAQDLADAGAAVVLPQPALVDGGLRPVLADLLDDQARLAEMARAAAGLGRIDAGDVIVDAAARGFTGDPT